MHKTWSTFSIFENLTFSILKLDGKFHVYVKINLLQTAATEILICS